MRKPKRKNILWSSNFAYAIGLLTTDGSLSSDGRHFDLTSKDRQQLVNFMHCLNIKVKIGSKKSGMTGKKISRIQFGDVVLYNFLLGIGFTPAKTKTMAEIKVPKKFFFDFLRGHHDGDGTFYSYFDPRWRNSFMFYSVFISASKKHIDWIRRELKNILDVKGHLTESGSIYQLKYAKNESLKLLPRMYYTEEVVCLRRKRLKIEKALGIIGKQL